MTRTLVVVTVILLAGAPRLRAEDAKVDGTVATGLLVEGPRKGIFDNEFKIGVKTKRSHGVRGEGEIRGRSHNPEVKLRKAVIDYAGDDGFGVRIGIDKKVLGTEYEYGDRLRLSPERTMIYRKLETLAYVGHEMAARLRWENVAGWDLAASLGYSDSRNTNMMGSVQRSECLGTMLCGVWGLSQLNRIEGTNQTGWATVWSLWNAPGETDPATYEVVVGKDAFETFYARFFGHEADVHFLGARGSWGLLGRGVDDDRLQPFVLLGVLWPDAKKSAVNALSGGFGIKFVLDRFRIAAVVEAVAANSRVDLKERSYENSRAALQGAVDF